LLRAAILWLLINASVKLDCASAANNAEQYSDDGNYKQGVDDAAGVKSTEVANCPNDDENDGDDIQEVAHGERELKEVKEKRSVSAALYAAPLKRI
jgi:hypothetical protein